MVIAAGFLLGLIFGSLALALADRSLTDGSFLGRSRCPDCQHKLGWRDLFPLLSFLALRGRCRYCKGRISWQYPAAEILMGLLFAAVFWTAFPHFPGRGDLYLLVSFFYGLILRLFMVVVLVIVAITDLKKTIIPDRVTIPAMIVVLAGTILFLSYRVWYLYQTMMGSEMGRYLVTRTDYFTRHALYVGGGLFGSLAMALVIGGFFLLLILVTRGRGMGGGDLKLGVLIGLYFGYPNAISAIILSFVLGSVAAILLVLSGRKKFGQTIPFGPFLSLGAILTILFAQQILQLYANYKLL